MTLASIIMAIAVVGFLLTIVPLLVWAERKVCARIQNRVGPNRVGPFGLLQPVADAVKLLTKEETVPAQAERSLYYLAPLLAFVPAALAFSVIPVGKSIRMASGAEIPLAVANLDVGVVFVLAITSLGVYGLAFAGWAANSKYSFLGGLRSSAQLISYEVAMGLAIVSLLMTSGALNMGDIVSAQQERWGGFFPAWNIFRQPIAALIFLIAAFAENNRLPFDLPEAEPELAAGYHTEYSGLKFAWFMFSEYIAMLTMSGVMITLFLGGWGFPGLTDGGGTGAVVLSVIVFLAKLTLMILFYMWVRWTLPRFRYDQLMRLGWKVLVPLALANVLFTGLVGVMQS